MTACGRSREMVPHVRRTSQASIHPADLLSELPGCCIGVSVHMAQRRDWFTQSDGRQVNIGRVCERLIVSPGTSRLPEGLD